MSDAPPEDEPAPIVREDTRAIIMSAGIHRQQARGRQVVLAAVGVCVIAGVVLGLDAAGVIQLLSPPPVETAPEPAAASTKETPKPQAAPSGLRDALLGTDEPSPAATSPSKAPATDGALDAKSLFTDANKSPTTMTLDARDIRSAVALPDGLTGEAIAQVVSDNGTVTKLCITEGVRAGTMPKGKIEFDVTIGASGSVSGVRTRSAQAQGSPFANCMEKRMAGWRFPSFEGEPVVVVIPYVMSGGMF
ncbi:MAG: AgmX/PglI C-terminal domain-containing protein [Myxococcota bacterium]